MAITRTNIVDDDGSGTTGTVLGNTWKQELYDQIDDALAAIAIPAIQGRICDGRLTLTSGTPVTTGDVTAATSIYFTPFGGDGIDLYSSGAWSTLAFTEITLALGTVTSGACYDIFAYNNSGAVALEKLVWTNTTTRATALARQDGVLVKSGDATRRYLGTCYTTSTTTTEDSVTKRYLYNYAHRQPRPLQRYESNTSWTYATATWRQANASAANQVEWVTGVEESAVRLAVYGVAANASTNVLIGIGIGIDITNNVDSVQQGPTFNSLVANIGQATYSPLTKYCGVGRHVAAWVEYSGSGTTTFYGSNFHAGLVGVVDA
jgi:hypothetical protein